MAETTERTEKTGSRFAGLLEELPTDELLDSGRNLLAAVARRSLSSLGDKVEETTERLTDYAENGGPGLSAALTGAQSMAQGKSPLRAALGAGMSGIKEKVQQALGGGSGGGGGSGSGKMKFTNIIEQIDVGVPVRVAYNQWTQFQDFPEIMKKVERADAESDKEEVQKLNWKAQVLWSHRSWEATVMEQVPDRHIVWQSTAQKGHVDGAVTFHELAPNLTRILVVLEYHQQGFVEGTANLWRAAGRRARLELKHFARHVMTRTILSPEDVEGWRGEIHDGEVVKTHEEALEEENAEATEAEEREDLEPADEEPPGEYDDEDREDSSRDRDEYDDEEARDADEEYAETDEELSQREAEPSRS